MSAELESIYELDSGLPMFVYEGTGLSDVEIRASVMQSMYEDSLPGYQFGVTEGRWGWSPRMKHCGNFDSGWPCDQEGGWHRHFSPSYPGALVTVVTVYGPRRAPSPHPDVRFIAAMDGEPK